MERLTCPTRTMKAILDGQFAELTRLSIQDGLHGPGVILLLIGVNDYNQNDDVANAHTRLEGLVENLATNRPYAKIIVANLLATTLEPPDAEIQTTFNPFVPMIASNEQALGREVYFDDLRSAVTTNDLADGLHPNQIGYNKMATNWFASLTNYISPL